MVEEAMEVLRKVDLAATVEVEAAISDSVEDVITAAGEVEEGE